MGLTVPCQQAAPKKRRTMEYVSIPLLYHVIRSAMGQCRPESSPEHQAQFMRMWSYLVAITGTDFTRGAPHIGPKKVWDMLGSAGVWEGLTQSYDTESMQMDPQRACDTFVASLYKVRAVRRLRRCRSVGPTHATRRSVGLPTCGPDPRHAGQVLQACEGVDDRRGPVGPHGVRAHEPDQEPPPHGKQDGKPAV